MLKALSNPARGMSQATLPRASAEPDRGSARAVTTDRALEQSSRQTRAGRC
jgi:hypothetical protein